MIENTMLGLVETCYILVNDLSSIFHIDPSVFAHLAIHAIRNAPENNMQISYTVPACTKVL